MQCDIEAVGESIDYSRAMARFYLPTIRFRFPQLAKSTRATHNEPHQNGLIESGTLASGVAVAICVLTRAQP